MSPIDCEEVLRDLELFLDGEIAGARCEEVEAHLAGCRECMSRAEFRRRVRQIVAAKLCAEEVPPGLLERVRRALEAE